MQDWQLSACALCQKQYEMLPLCRPWVCCMLDLDEAVLGAEDLRLQEQACTGSAAAPSCSAVMAAAAQGLLSKLSPANPAA